ncbi:MAG: apolipoprotein N-acyltransferase [Pararhodobacter sp.]|nr:apolipoprotein N-acyltransferase [Pararhodobacter sp.]
MTGARQRLAAVLRAPWFWAVLAGPLSALGQAPWGLWPLTLLALALLMVALAPAGSVRAGFGLGWLAGTGSFALAMVWIIEPFFIEPDRHGWMAPFALVLMAGGLALFWGVAGAFAVWAVRHPVARLWVFALTMLAMEALRGVVFTGLPWAMLGHVWIDTPIAQLAAISGALGLSALTLGLAAGLATLWRRQRRGQGLRAGLAGLAVVAVLASVWAWGAARLAAPLPEDRALRLRLVQPNAPQALKWDRHFAEMFYYRHLDLTAAPADDGRAPDLVIWSETSVPFFLDNPMDGLHMAAEAAGGAILALGIQRRETGASGGLHYFNSLAVLDDAGTVTAVYDKHHLVPFGEYVPLLGQFADRPGMAWLSGFAAQALLGYTPGPGPRLLDMGDAGLVLPLICYEAIFARHLRTETRPDWILQITNDAWFGEWSGPYQHLAQARLRAIEQGLPLVRAANTGVSAVINARGQMVQSLGLNQAGFVDADLPGALSSTPYSRFGDTLWHLLLLAGIAGVGVKRLREKRLTPGT